MTHHLQVLSGKDYGVERTVVVDESSMLTLDDMVAVRKALDLGHVHRIILVGDPNQLPPIGVGRPFADFAGFLEKAQEREEDDNGLTGTLARLTTEVRATAREPSDTLKLASWFTPGSCITRTGECSTLRSVLWQEAGG